MSRCSWIVVAAAVAAPGCSRSHPEDGVPMPALPQFQPGEPARPKPSPMPPLPKYEEPAPAGMQPGPPGAPVVAADAGVAAKAK